MSRPGLNTTTVVSGACRYSRLAVRLMVPDNAAAGVACALRGSRRLPLCTRVRPEYMLAGKCMVHCASTADAAGARRRAT